MFFGFGFGLDMDRRGSEVVFFVRGGGAKLSRLLTVETTIDDINPAVPIIGNMPYNSFIV